MLALKNNDSMNKIYLITKIYFFSLLLSHVKYGISVYGATTKTNLDYILKIQNKVIRVIFYWQGWLYIDLLDRNLRKIEASM